MLSEAAYERLRTIGEQTELGAGFKIAMRDLEIRGAGNLLGRDQSGHIAAVGYDLYVQLVAEAVAEMKGEPLRPPVEVTIDVPSDAHLPADYVAREDLRLEAYRRLAAVSDAEQIGDIRAEWTDRFGPPPPPAEGLLAVARLRVQCLRTGVREVSATPARPGPGGSLRRGVTARLAPLDLPASARVRLRRLRPQAIVKDDLHQLIIPLGPDEAPVETLTSLLAELVPDPGVEPGAESSGAGAPVECPFREAPPRSGRLGRAGRAGRRGATSPPGGHRGRRRPSRSPSSRTSSRKWRATPSPSAPWPSRTRRGAGPCPPSTAARRRTVTSTFAAFVLDRMVQQTLEQHALAQHHATVTSADVAVAANDYRDQFEFGQLTGDLAVRAHRQRPRQPAPGRFRDPAGTPHRLAGEARGGGRPRGREPEPRCRRTTCRIRARSPSCASTSSSPTTRRRLRPSTTRSRRGRASPMP